MAKKQPTPKKPARGRPFLDPGQKLSETLTVKFKPVDMATIEAAAAAADEDVRAFTRRVLLAEAARRPH